MMGIWRLVLAAALAATAAWTLTPAWPDERAGRLAGAVDRRGLGAVGSGLVRGSLQRVAWGPADRRRRARARVRVIQALTALAGELQSGQPPILALVSSAGTPPAWPVASTAARLGHDVVPALMEDARSHEVLRHLAACWQVASDSGAGLSAAVSALAASARTAEDLRVQLEAELAGPRATARTLVALPLVGLGFGLMMGADPLGWLLSTSPGRICLMAGAGLTALGTWWTGRIAARVESML